MIKSINSHNHLYEKHPIIHIYLRFYHARVVGFLKTFQDIKNHYKTHENHTFLSKEIPKFEGSTPHNSLKQLGITQKSLIID